ncbi:MAG: phenylacetate--CoA ligase, partial [Clostridia bacterium]|nr:phenylacetate--CoA ligase [Clostridia bacterium]
MAYWQPEFETMPREEIRKDQSKKLKWQVQRMYENVELFRKRMDEMGLTPDDINGVEDLSKLPFSYKQDLRDYYPYGLFAVPMKDIRRVHASSGTTGKQIVVGYTDNDLEMWSDCFARMLIATGADENSFVHVGYGLGLFTGGFGAHDGAVRIGATAIPISAGNTQRQIQTMIDFGSTVLCCTPSY